MPGITILMVFFFILAIFLAIVETWGNRNSVHEPQDAEKMKLEDFYAELSAIDDFIDSCDSENVKLCEQAAVLSFNRLNRLAPFVPDGTPELDRFKQTFDKWKKKFYHHYQKAVK